MATLQQVRLETYAHRNVVDDLLAYGVTLPPDSAGAPAAIDGLQRILDSLHAQRIPCIIASGAAAAAVEALVSGDNTQAVELQYGNGRKFSVAMTQFNGSDVLQISMPDADITLHEGPWSTPAGGKCLTAVLQALAGHISALVAVDVRPPPKERFVGGDADRISVYCVPCAPSANGSKLPSSVKPVLGTKSLPSIAVKELPPPLFLNGMPAVVISAARTQAPLAGLPCVALRVFAPAADITSVDAACVAVSAVGAALSSVATSAVVVESTTSSSTVGTGGGPFSLTLPAAFSKGFQTALRKMRASGAVSMGAMMAS